MDRLEEKKHTRHFEPLHPRGRRPSRFSFGRFLYWLSLLVFLGVIVYVLFFSQFLTVFEIKLNGLSQIDAQTFKSFVAEQFFGKYFDLVPKNNLLIIVPKNISRAVTDRFKLVEGIQIKKIFPNTLAVSIVERNPSLILCSRDDCFVIDEKGTAFAKADPETNQLGESELFTLKNDGDKEISVGDGILNPDYLQYLALATDKLKNDIGADVEKEIKTPQLISGDIRMMTQEGWLIYFDKSIAIQKEIEMLKVVLDEKIEPGKRADLEYIDLRTDNKVYYKFKTVEPAENSEPVQKTQKAEPKKK